MSERKCFFATKCLGINTQPPEFGLIVDFPATIQIEGKRREERVENGIMKFLSTDFTLEGEKKLYQLDVFNLGSHGIGLIVNRENYDLLDKINVGDTIKNLKFFLKIATLTIDGKVRHKTQIRKGKLKGSYVLGIKPRLCSKHLLRPEKPCCNARFTILLLNLVITMPSAQNRSNFSFR